MNSPGASPPWGSSKSINIRIQGIQGALYRLFFRGRPRRRGGYRDRFSFQQPSKNSLIQRGGRNLILKTVHKAVNKTKDLVFTLSATATQPILRHAHSSADQGRVHHKPG